MTDVDFYSICRICLKYSGFYSDIYCEKLTDETYLIEIVNDLLQLDMGMEDGMPKYLCSDCYNKISSFELFKRFAQEGKTVLECIRDRMKTDLNNRETGDEDRNEELPCIQNEDLNNRETGDEDRNEELPCIQNEIYLKPVKEENESANEDEKDPLGFHLPIVKVEKESTKEEKEERDPLGVNVKGEPYDEEMDLNHEEDLEQNPSGLEAESFSVHRKFPVTAEKDPLCPSEDSDDHTYADEYFMNVVIPKEESISEGEHPVSMEKDPLCFTSDDSNDGNGNVSKNITDKHKTPNSEPNPPTSSQEKADAGLLRFMLEGNAISQTTAKEDESNASTMQYPVKGRRVKNFLKCDACQATFTDARKHANHKRSHKSMTAVQCNLCGNRFENSSDLDTHKRIHSGERPFKCDMCTMRFISNSHLISHRKSHKTGNFVAMKDKGTHGNQKAEAQKEYQQRLLDKDRIHKCKLCGKCFREISQLRTHKTLHKRNRPFRCGLCDMSFFQKFALLSHFKTHAGERHFKCDFCGECFAKKSHLINHNKHNRWDLIKRVCIKKT